MSNGLGIIRNTLSHGLCSASNSENLLSYAYKGSYYSHSPLKVKI